MTMITPSYLGETIEYSSLHACRSTLEDPTEYLARAHVPMRNFCLLQQHFHRFQHPSSLTEPSAARKSTVSLSFLLPCPGPSLLVDTVSL